MHPRRRLAPLIDGEQVIVTNDSFARPFAADFGIQLIRAARLQAIMGQANRIRRHLTSRLGYEITRASFSTEAVLLNRMALSVVET